MIGNATGYRSQQYFSINVEKHKAGDHRLCKKERKNTNRLLIAWILCKLSFVCHCIYLALRYGPYVVERLYIRRGVRVQLINTANQFARSFQIEPTELFARKFSCTFVQNKIKGYLC